MAMPRWVLPVPVPPISTTLRWSATKLPVARSGRGDSAGGYTILNDMRERERRRREVFVLLTHPPEHAHADFGAARVIIGGIRQKEHFFVLNLLQSDPWREAFLQAYTRRW